MKKIPAIFFSVLMVSTIFSNMGSASGIADEQENIKWWTVSELLEFASIVDSEKAAICGEDIDCLHDYAFSRLENGDKKFEALTMLQNQQFWITEVDPAKEEIKAIYFDENPMLKRMGISERHQLDFIFAAWFDHSEGLIGHYNHELPIEPQFPDDLHLIYAGDARSFNAINGFPVAEEFYLPVNPTGLQNNSRGIIELATYGGQYNSGGHINYSSCLTSPEYFVGEKCQLMFSAEKGHLYLPPRTINDQFETVDSPSTNSEEITPPQEEPVSLLVQDENDEKDSGSGPKAIYIDIVQDGTAKTDSLVLADQPALQNSTTTREWYLGNDNIYAIQPLTATDAPTTRNKEIELPKAHSPSREECEKRIYFPWWIIVFLVVGDALLMWWLWPKRKNDKKVHKIS